jgi:hypothetical protein
MQMFRALSADAFSNSQTSVIIYMIEIMKMINIIKMIKMINKMMILLSLLS